MRLERYADAERFLDDIRPALRRREAENDLIPGIVWGLRAEEARGDRYMVAVHDAGAVRIAAALTPPYKLVLSTGEADALPMVVDDLHRDTVPLPGVVGPSEPSFAFAASWTRATGEPTPPGLEMTLYSLTEVLADPPASGFLRRAIADDSGWLCGWMRGFAEEAGLSWAEREASDAITADAVRRGRIFLWEEHGTPMAMACCRDTGETSARIGPVFTPPEQRRRGYGTACVAALTHRLLEAGKRSCRLFADVANPSADEIYRRVGYRPVCAYQEFPFEDEPV